MEGFEGERDCIMVQRTKALYNSTASSLSHHKVFILVRGGSTVCCVPPGNSLAIGISWT